MVLHVSSPRGETLDPHTHTWVRSEERKVPLSFTICVKAVNSQKHTSSLLVVVWFDSLRLRRRRTSLVRSIRETGQIEVKQDVCVSSGCHLFSNLDSETAFSGVIHLSYFAASRFRTRSCDDNLL